MPKTCCLRDRASEALNDKIIQMIKNT